MLPIFLEEADELTESINENLRNWRANPADGEIARSLHRLFHTLKGSARMAGAMMLGEITHAIEARVEQAAKAGSATPELIDEIEFTLDSVAQILERMQQGETVDTAPRLKPRKVNRALQHLMMNPGPVPWFRPTIVSLLQKERKKLRSSVRHCVFVPILLTSWSTRRVSFPSPAHVSKAR